MWHSLYCHDLGPNLWYLIVPTYFFPYPRYKSLVRYISCKCFVRVWVSRWPRTMEESCPRWCWEASRPLHFRATSTVRRTEMLQLSAFLTDPPLLVSRTFRGSQKLWLQELAAGKDPNPYPFSLGTLPKPRSRDGETTGPVSRGGLSPVCLTLQVGSWML